MSWLSRLLGYVTKEERAGISLGDAPRWRVSPTRDLAAFLRALPDLVPEGSILFLEGGYPTEDINSFLEARAAQNTCKVELGTIWPRPRIYHMPITPENIEGLAALADKHAAPEIAIHLHVYRDGRMSVEWYDACDRDPLYVSKELDEARVAAFCEALGLEYAPVNDDQ